MNINRNRMLMLFLGLTILVVTLCVSQLRTETVVIQGSNLVHINAEAPVTAVEISLKLDDKIEIRTRQIRNLIPIVVSINFLGRSSMSSQPAVNTSVSWICNGDQNYAIDVRFSDSSSAKETDVLLYYKVTRGNYRIIWLFPTGLIVGGIFTLKGLEFRHSDLKGRREGSVNSQLINGRKPRVEKIVCTLSRKMISIDHVALVLLVIFLATSLSINVEMLHNDEIGGGKIDNWGYYAWGCVDTAKQVSDLLAQGDVGYDSWHAVQNMNKPILPIYFMTLLMALFPTLDPLIAGRLFVQISSALACVIVYLLVKDMFDRKSGVLASLLLFFNPIFLHYTRTAYGEGPFLLFASLFFLFLYKSALPSRKYVYLAGIALGLAISTKSPMFLYLFVPLALIWLLMKKDQRLPQKSWLDALLMTSQIGLIAIVMFFIHWPALWIDPLSKLAFLGMFLGMLGPYGPSFVVYYPELFLGRVTKPHPFVQSVVYLVFQTTFIELLGFILGIVYLFSFRKSRTNIRLFFSVFLVTLVGSSILYRYQHHLTYLIWPYTIISAVSYTVLSNSLRTEPSLRGLKLVKSASTSKIFTRVRNLLSLSLLVFAVLGQIILVMLAAPYYGLYYNTFFLGGKQPNEMFQIPEPVYGLDQIAEFIRGNPAATRRILTTNAPHIVQAYFPDYTIVNTPFLPLSDDLNSLLILRSLDFEYVIVGESTLQVNPSLPLKRALDKYAEQVLVSRGGDLPLAYLYRIPSISWNHVIWQNNHEYANDWSSTAISERCSFDVLQDGQISVELNFSNGYPPPLWFKLFHEFRQPINLDNASLYLVSSSSVNSNVTFSLSMLDQDRSGVEAVLKPATLRYSNENVLFIRLSDLTWKGNPTDLSRIARIELTFYNFVVKTFETIVIEEVALVS